MYTWEVQGNTKNKLRERIENLEKENKELKRIIRMENQQKPENKQIDRPAVLRKHIHDSVKVLERERERLQEENRIEAAKCQVESHVMLRNNKHLKEIKSLIESGYRWIEKLSQRENGKEVVCS